MAKAPRKTAAPAPAPAATETVLPAVVFDAAGERMPAPEPVANKHGVSSKVWNSWAPAQQNLFNELFRYMYDNQPLFKHTKAPLLETAQWKTVAWNAAWVAADLSKEA